MSPPLPQYALWFGPSDQKLAMSVDLMLNILQTGYLGKLRASIPLSRLIAGFFWLAEHSHHRKDNSLKSRWSHYQAGCNLECWIPSLKLLNVWQVSSMCHTTSTKFPWPFFDPSSVPKHMNDLCTPVFDCQKRRQRWLGQLHYDIGCSPNYSVLNRA